MLSTCPKPPLLESCLCGVNFLDLPGFHGNQNDLGQEVRTAKCRWGGRGAAWLYPGSLLP